MNTTELAQLTADLLTQYYDNNIEPFFNHCHEDVLWLGPAKGQMIRGKRILWKHLIKKITHYLLKYTI